MKIIIPEPPERSTVIVVIKNGHYNYGALTEECEKYSVVDPWTILIHNLRKSLDRAVRNKGEQ